jgi:serine/threonine protein kinase
MMQQTELRDGRYKLTHILGSGGMATVYKGYDTQLDLARAVKVLAPAFVNRAVVRKRFTVEAQTMAKLQHPHIVSVVDVGVERNQPYMVMEYLAGGSVSLRVEKLGALSPRQSCTVLRHLLLALQEAHSRGIVHRDIKPHNILITVDGLLKVADFGIAHIADSDHGLTQTGMVMGTLAYMSPEQRTSAKGADPRSDLYAAAATFYNVLTGKEPYDLFSTDIQAKVLGDLPEAVRAFIARGIQYEAEERFQSATEMLDALDAMVAGLAPESEPLTPLPVPLEIQGELGELETSQPSFETFDSSLAMDTNYEPSGSFDTSDSIAPPTYRDISIHRTETAEVPAPKSSAFAIIVGALIIAAVIGFGFSQLQPAPPLPAAPQVSPPAVPAAEEEALDVLDDKLEEFGHDVAPTVEAKDRLEREISTQKIKTVTEQEQVEEELRRLLEADSKLERTFSDVVEKAGGDLDKLGQSKFLVELPSEIRGLFIRQQELIAQGRRLENQVKLLEALSEERIRSPEPEPASEPEPPVAPTKKPKPVAVKVVSEPVVDPATLPKGTLTVNSFPWGNVTFDEKALGTTPQTIQTTAGKHIVKIVTKAGQSEEQELSVPAGKAKSFCWDFNEGDVCK